ncbi:centrosomal protein of 68 kDa [Solea solea]|uniref:centrosomal protein of 68 kDa n=1 Tax=Solea solea TaxID=90069 RepID=UPI00272A0562|nr:centrosomal protein of 68 kDa [Solea solea]
MNQTRQTDTNRGGSHRHVSLAPPSRCLTDRQLLLSSTKPHASILKENRCDVYRRDFTDMSFWTRPREERAQMSRDVSPPSGAQKHCGSSVAVSELRGGRGHEEHTFRSSSEQSLSGSIPEFDLPLRQSLTSTVLNPTYTPQPGHLKSGQKEGRGLGRSDGDLTSPHKANYWACAIPKDVLQSPDRHSAGWDPNKDYQALLDYTYPLRTNPLTCDWDSAERHKHSLLQADMQDSGIDLENICSWTSVSGLDVSVSSTEHTEERSHRRLDRSFTELQGEEPLFLTDPVSLYLNNVDSSKSGSDHHLQRHEWPCSTSTALTRSSRILHQPVCACMEEDEEFRRLPEQLSELQLLSTQVCVKTHFKSLTYYVAGTIVRVIAAQLRQQSRDPGTSSIFSSVTSPEKPEAKNKTREDNSQDDTGKEWNVPQSAAAAAAAAHRDSVALRSNGRWVEPVGGRSSASGLRKVECLLEQLCDLTLHQSSQGQQEQSDSLLQHIQVFCSHLEQLIQHLYAASEKIELLAQPAVDITRLKLSLDEYQREVRNHLPLTSCVMHSGQLLLRCINSMSPFLRDTLQLVARESEALQSYNQHFSTDNVVQQSRDQSSLGVQ